MRFALNLLGLGICRASLSVLIVPRHFFLLLFFNKALCCHLGVRLYLRNNFISAYRPNYSAKHLLRLTEDWRSRDSKETVTIASKDLSKAFDSIPHALLLARLKANDLSEMSIELLRSYLSATIPHLKLETRFLNGNW